MIPQRGTQAPPRSRKPAGTVRGPLQRLSLTVFFIFVPVLSSTAQVQDLRQADIEAIQGELSVTLQRATIVSFGTPSSSHQMTEGLGLVAISPTCDRLSLRGATADGREFTATLTPPVRISVDDAWVNVEGDRVLGDFVPAAKPGSGG